MVSEVGSEPTTPAKGIVAWSWSPQHQLSFDALKKQLIDTPVLRFFDLKLPIVVTCDASRFGLGAACMQLCEGDSLLPVSFASRTMTHIHLGLMWTFFPPSPRRWSSVSCAVTLPRLALQ